MATFNPIGIWFDSNNPPTLNTDSFAQTVLRLSPNGSTPIYVLSNELGKSRAVATQHGYHTKEQQFVSVLNQGSAAGGATTLTTDNVDGLVPGSVLEVQSTREHLRVLTVPTPTSITVERGFGRVAAATIPDQEVLLGVGSAYTRASARPQERSIPAQYIPNYTVICRTSWAISNTDRATMAEAGWMNIAETKTDAMMLHSQDIELHILWGQPKAPSGSPPIHTTQGVEDAMYQYAPANVTSMGATTNYDQLVAATEMAFEKNTDIGNPNIRVGFGDAAAMRVLDQIGYKYVNVRTTQLETSFGMSFKEFQHYKGRIIYREHPIMNGSNLAPGRLLILDMPSIRLAYLEDREVMIEEYNGALDSTNNGIDAGGGSMTTEFAVESRNPGGGALLLGLTAGAA